MNIAKKLVGDEDERAVSPVIGVILMVAITVILAAVIAAFVLDMGDLDESAPSAQYEWETDSGDINWNHQSGDDIELSNVEVRVEYSTDGDVSENPGTTSGLSTTFTAGDSVTITAVDEDDSTKDTVDVNGNTALTAADDATDLTTDDIDKITVTWNGDGSSSILDEYEP